MFTAAFYPLSHDPLIPATAPTLNVDETSIKKKKTQITLATEGFRGWI